MSQAELPAHGHGHLQSQLATQTLSAPSKLTFLHCVVGAFYLYA